MDEFDRASELEQVQRDEALYRHRQQTTSNKTSARQCRVCEEPIPDARRTAQPGVQTCVACQQELDAALKRRK